ncbi:conserved exported hypothetical protein [Vibrio chagasii]|nr:conserved exported hypothetical protein [Vibrio chagasii]CAH7075888.1 conserved exported hypothetical protein [Vibrio chagasii]CAH7167020.1 conserved exported hypothetical protein [Vibrio chagasii]CAH7198480.1 conserved exported hypothetical protein [Vibrio chagasii]CAH7199753.1 conserved exported hypothetical protein [Vibrio chagasii]
MQLILLLTKKNMNNKVLVISSVILSFALSACGGGSSSSDPIYPPTTPEWEQLSQGITYDYISYGSDYEVNYHGKTIYAVSSYDGTRGAHNYNLFSYKENETGSRSISFYGVIVRSELNDLDYLYTYNNGGITKYSSITWTREIYSGELEANANGLTYTFKSIDDLPRVGREMSITSGHVMISDPTRDKEYIGNYVNDIQLTQTGYDDYTLNAELYNNGYTFDYYLSPTTYGTTHLSISEKSNQISLINSSYAETIALFDHENILSFDVQHDFKTDEILYTVSSFSENFGLNRIGSISYEYSDITELNN